MDSPKRLAQILNVYDIVETVLETDRQVDRSPKFQAAEILPEKGYIQPTDSILDPSDFQHLCRQVDSISAIAPIRPGEAGISRPAGQIGDDFDMPSLFMDNLLDIADPSRVIDPLHEPVIEQRQVLVTAVSR